jgi:hypothetical protein
MKTATVKITYREIPTDSVSRTHTKIKTGSCGCGQNQDPENKTDSARLGLLGNAKSGTNDEETRCTDNICWRSSCEPKPSQQQFAQIRQNPKETRVKQNRCKNEIFIENRTRFTSLRMSLLSIPHLIIEMKNIFLTHSL